VKKGRGFCRGYYDTNKLGTVDEYGERYSCIYNNHHIIFLGWYQGSEERSLAGGREGSLSVAFIDREFSRENIESEGVQWRYCVHHRTSMKLTGGSAEQSRMDVDSITDACRRHGALIISGHHHIYARTKMLETVGGKSSDPLISEDQEIITEGRTMSIVVGNGGYKGNCDGKHSKEKWFHICKGGKRDRGAVIATFDENEGQRATFQYKNSLSGIVEDRFEIESNLQKTIKGKGLL